MALNKKQKKQLEVAKKKKIKLQQLLSAAKAQPDDPSEITDLESQITTIEAEIQKIKSGG